MKSVLEIILNTILFFLLNFHEQANFRDIYSILGKNITSNHLTNLHLLQIIIDGTFLDGNRNPYPLLEEKNQIPKNQIRIKTVLYEKATELNVSEADFKASDEVLKGICEKLVWKYTDGT